MTLNNVLYLEETTAFILLSVGSRTLENRDWVRSLIREDIKACHEEHGDRLIVASGHAVGPDIWSELEFEELTGRKAISKIPNKDTWYWYKKRTLELIAIGSRLHCYFDYESRTFGCIWTYNHFPGPKKLYIIQGDSIIRVIKEPFFQVGPPNTKYNYRFKKK